MYKKAVLIGIVVLLCIGGCAHRKHISAGDEAMARGDAEMAVEHYRQAQVMKPGSESIANKLDRAEEELLAATLGQLASEVSGEAADEAMVKTRRAAGLIDDEARLEMLERRAQRIVLRESARRQDRQDFRGALHLIDVHVDAFGDPLEAVADRDRAIRAGWYEALRAEGDEYRDRDQFAAAALYFSKANAVAGIKVSQGRAGDAYGRLLADQGWVVNPSMEGEEEWLAVLMDVAFAQDLPAAVTDGRSDEARGRSVALAMEMAAPTFEGWDESEIRSGEYQSGTEWVTNPEYEEGRQRVLDAEERVLRAEREVTDARRELRQAERELRDDRRNGRSTSFSESRLDRAYDTLDRRQAQLEDRQYDLEQQTIALRRIPQQIEEPVYSEHRYEVILQHGALFSEMAAEVSIGSDGFGAEVEQFVEYEESSEYYDAQPELKMSARHEAPPAAGPMERPFYETAGKHIAAFLDRSFEMYRDDQVVALDRLSDEERMERLARFVLLDPDERDGQIEEALVDLSGFEDGPELLIRLARQVQ